MADGLVAVISCEIRGGGDFLMSQRLADIEMDIALLLTNARDNAHEIFSRTLDILLPLRNTELPGLHDIARLVFIGNT